MAGFFGWPVRPKGEGRAPLQQSAADIEMQARTARSHRGAELARRVLGLPDAHPNHRPSADYKKCRTAETLFAAVCAADGSGGPKPDDAWFGLQWTKWEEANGKQPRLSSEKAAPAPFTAPDAAPDAPPAAGKKNFWSNPLAQLLLRSLVHMWNKDGSHSSFKTINDFRNCVLDILNVSIPPSTVGRYHKAEVDAYAAGKGLRKKPNVLAAVLSEYKESKEFVEKLGVEPAAVPGTAYKFLPEWYEELKEASVELFDLVGFGGPTVQGLAAAVVLEHTDEDEKALAWIPSIDWCHWFMHKHLHLEVRKVTGSASTPEMIAKQDELQLMNLQRFAVRLANGLKPKYFYGSDQFGIHLFPHAGYKWARKGEGHITHVLKEDKRQLTGDIRECMCVAVAYEASLSPSRAVAVLLLVHSCSHQRGRRAAVGALDQCRQDRHL